MKMGVGHWWHDAERGKQLKYWEEKACQNVNLCIANLTWAGWESNPGLQGERPKFQRP